MKKNKLLITILLLVAFISLIISLLQIIKGIFPITFDQGRDFLWVKNQVDFKRPSLVGPWGSLVGTFFGPLWFWLLTIPYLISNGSPIAMTLFNSFIIFSSLLLAAFLFLKHNKSVAYFIIFLGFISPVAHNLANYPFSQHLLPLLTILLIYSFTMVLINTNRLHFLLSFFWISLIYHAEPPIAVFSLLSLITITYFSKKKTKILNLKTLLLSSIFFIIPFLPLILFDLRHDFIQSKSIISLFLGQNQSLKEIAPLSFWQRLIDRPLKFLTAFKESILSFPNIISFFLLSLIFYLNHFKIKQNFLKKFWQASLIYIFSIFIISIFYPYDFKMFYLDGIKFIFIIWTAIALNFCWQQRKLKRIVVFFLTITFFINLRPFSFISSLKQNFADRRNYGSLYINKAEILDWIYQTADNQGFKVYTFVPAVYDYDYQYMFFWYGLKQYDYLPADFSYSPDKPEYIPKKTEQLQRLQDKIKPASDLVYFIINRGSKKEKADWQYGLPKENLQLLKTKSFPDNTLVKQYKIADIN